MGGQIRGTAVRNSHMDITKLYVEALAPLLPSQLRSYISSGKGLLIVSRYRFLFERFRHPAPLQIPSLAGCN